jgi:hypothetical protein
VVIGSDGEISGAPLDLGVYPLVLRATDALGLTATASVTLDIASPSIPIARLGDAFFLGGQPLDSLQRVFLDRQGNANGVYDLGDFRAWTLASPSLPLSAELVTPAGAASPTEARAITLPVRFRDREEAP